MICSIIKILASHAYDRGKPLPGFVRNHSESCTKCRSFVEASNNLEILLPSEAEHITIPKGLETTHTVNTRAGAFPAFITVAAIIVIMLALTHKGNRHSVSIDSLSIESTSAVNEIMNDTELAGIFTGSLIQEEMDALVADAQTAIASMLSLMEFTP